MMRKHLLSYRTHPSAQPRLDPSRTTEGAALTNVVLAVGERVGATLRDTVGATVGEHVGAALGDAVGETVGERVGAPLGDAVGFTVDAVVGRAEGAYVTPITT